MDVYIKKTPGSSQSINQLWDRGFSGSHLLLGPRDLARIYNATLVHLAKDFEDLYAHQNQPFNPHKKQSFKSLNALVHRRYQSGVQVQIRVYPDRLVCWNDGPLPEEISLDELLGVHSSHPRNPLIADACFKAGYIDTWGRGISKITETCQQASLPYPSFEEAENGICVTLFSASTPEATLQNDIKMSQRWDQVGTKSGPSFHSPQMPEIQWDQRSHGNSWTDQQDQISGPSTQTIAGNQSSGDDHSR